MRAGRRVSFQKHFSRERVDNLRALFKAGKKLKATDLVKVLSEAPKEQLP
jgi:replication initiation and membrane attachment protein DnaB